MSRLMSNEFTWSKSRHDKFNECLRAYYLHYYRSWGGWELDAAPEVRELYVLKNLDNRFTWSGTVVHDVIRRALVRTRQGRDVDPAHEIERAHRLMRNDWRFSSSRGFWYRKSRDDFSGLAEHEYALPIPGEVWKLNWETVKTGLEWFFHSRWPALAKSLQRHQWIAVDPNGFEEARFPLEGVQVFAIPDFAYREADGTPVVVDWKTGKSRPGHEDQVIGYALYLARRHGAPLERVKGRLVFLSEGLEVEVPVTEVAVEAFLGRFRESVRTMREKLSFSSSNIPREEAAFPRTDRLELCQHCAFRRPCGRDPGATTVRLPPAPTAQAPLDFS